MFQLEEAKAIILVKEAKELIDSIIHLNKSDESKVEMVARATQVLENNKGSVDKHLNKIAEVF